MKLSVHIPTFRRPGAINQCLDHLASQVCPSDFEIIVGLDGPADATPDPIVPASIRSRTRVLRMPKLGYIGVRRAMLECSQGEIVLWLNDDSYASPGLLEAHLAMHAHGMPRVVAGISRWKEVENRDLFDRLVQETDLLFFHQPGGGGEPFRTGYRHCFGLNMSFSQELACSVGGVPDISAAYGYDDLELAYRLEKAGAEIWCAPGAVVIHDHRYRPEDVHRREYLLGQSAWHYARSNPEFAWDLFGRDVCSSDELAYIAEVLVRERRDAERIERAFLSMGQMPGDGASDAVVQLLVGQWVLLKRYLWRWGLLDAASGSALRWSFLRDASSILPMPKR